MHDWQKKKLFLGKRLVTLRTQAQGLDADQEFIISLTTKKPLFDKNQTAVI
jgi:hypothetical protein